MILLQTSIDSPPIFWFPRRVYPDLCWDWELLIPHGGPKGSHLPDADLLCQRENEGGQTAGGQPARRVSVVRKNGDLERKDAEDPACLALHLGLQHYSSGILSHGENLPFILALLGKVLNTFNPVSAQSQYFLVSEALSLRKDRLANVGLHQGYPHMPLRALALNTGVNTWYEGAYNLCALPTDTRQVQGVA